MTVSMFNYPNISSQAVFGFLLNCISSYSDKCVPYTPSLILWLVAVMGYLIFLSLLAFLPMIPGSCFLRAAGGLLTGTVLSEIQTLLLACLSHKHLT